MNQFEGSHARMAMGIEVLWKPILWYVKESYPNGRGFLRDGIKIQGKEGQNKKLHKWQQDLDWYIYYIEKLTKPNDTVLDLFCGSGTVCVAAKMLNRQFIGIDISHEYCEIARNRLKEAKSKKELETQSTTNILK
ncbi:MAG: site-specific DNA-methyltransferase [Nanoarchaeota archaeon]